MRVGDLARMTFTHSYLGFITKVYDHGFEIWFFDGLKRVYDIGDDFQVEVVSESR